MTPKKDMLNLDFSAEQIQLVDDFIRSFLEVINPKAASLSPEMRSRYGSVRETNKLFLNKVKEMGEQRPDFIPREVDWSDFEKDYDMRILLERWIKGLESIVSKLRDSKTLLDYDNMSIARTIYRYLSFLYETGIPGSEYWRKELAQFFRRRKAQGTEELPPGDML